ncbi:MAG TPA: hypothetical protein VHA75_11040, partial [Rugosimonospora sp.]|nr:hypothetical protein [Rugosimonospora sp.]
MTEREIGPAAEPPKFDLVAWRHEQAMRVLAATVPPRFADAFPDDPAVLRWIERFLSKPEDCPSLFLCGPTGVGKSWLAWAALR